MVGQRKNHKDDIFSCLVAANVSVSLQNQKFITSEQKYLHDRLHNMEFSSSIFDDSLHKYILYYQIDDVGIYNYSYSQLFSTFYNLM